MGPEVLNSEWLVKGAVVGKANKTLGVKRRPMRVSKLVSKGRCDSKLDTVSGHCKYKMKKIGHRVRG